MIRAYAYSLVKPEVQIVYSESMSFNFSFDKVVRGMVLMIF